MMAGPIARLSTLWENRVLVKRNTYRVIDPTPIPVWPTLRRQKKSIIQGFRYH